MFAAMETAAKEYPQPREAAPPPSRAGRYPFIDVLRGLAVLFMIETHTVNALLDPALRAGTFHDALTYVNGLVAPAFLFAAGFSIVLQSHSQCRHSGGGTHRTARYIFA